MDVAQAPVLLALNDIQAKIDQLIEAQNPDHALEILSLRKELSDEKERHQETLSKLQDSEAKRRRSRAQAPQASEIARLRGELRALLAQIDEKNSRIYRLERKWRFILVACSIAVIGLLVI